jgi:hypothetical protein
VVREDRDMTKKHFVAIANMLKYHKESMPSNVHGLLIEGMADICQNCNTDFDRERFFKASGYYDERTSR